MSDVILPVGVQADIDETFCYDTERSYQDRAHEYIERYEITRDWFHGGTAVRSVVMDLCKRSFEAGAQMTCADRREEPPGSPMTRSERGEYLDSVLREFVRSGAEAATVPVEGWDSAHNLASGLRARALRGGMPIAVSKRNEKVYLFREES